MDTFEQFRNDLGEALGHLYDPDLKPAGQLFAVLGCDPHAGAGPLQSAILQAIQDLEPGADLPADGRPRLTFDILRHRFVLKLTQEQTADRLHMSVRTLRREQREAIHALAQLLWAHGLERAQAARPNGAAAEDATPETSDWRQQLKQELASLRANSPVRISDVAKTVDTALGFALPLAARRNVEIRLAPVRPGLHVALHPSALRQILTMSIAWLLECITGGAIDIAAASGGDQVTITLTGATSPDGALPNSELIEELLTSEGGSLHTALAAGRATLQMRIPLAGQVSVVVVEDNVDCVHYYQRCTAGTRYHLTHVHHGEGAVEAITAAAPGVIVLDIMLPDTDGWELLTRLQSGPETRSIPVIICSIVAQKDLASSLGAVRCLPKPVAFRDFIQALDQAMAGAPASAPPAAASNAANRPATPLPR